MKRLRMATFPASVLSIGVVVLALGMSSATAATSTAPSAAPAIKVGGYAPLSGANASAGVDMVRAMKLAVAKWNKAGGVLGRKITLDAQDSPCNPQVAVTAAQKLITDGVAGVDGPYCSGDAIPTSVLFYRAHIPLVDPAATNPKLTEQGFNNIFRTIGRDDEQGRFAAGIIVNRLHAKKVAIIHDNTVYAKGLADQTRLALGKYPGVSVVFFDAITSGSKDFSSFLTQLKTKSPDVTYFTGYYGDGGLLVKQFFQLGISGRFMAGDSNNDPTFIKLAGADAEKVLITTAPTIPGLLPNAKGFVRQYQATYHTGPGAYSFYSYDAMNILLRGVQKARSTSGPAIIRALHTVKNYHGITGLITFNAKGDRVQVTYLVETVRNGQFVRANP